MFKLIFRLPLTLIRLVILKLNSDYKSLPEQAKYNLEVYIAKGYKLPVISFSPDYFTKIHKMLMDSAPNCLELDEDTIYKGAIKLLELHIGTTEWAILQSQEEDSIKWRK